MEKLLREMDRRLDREWLTTHTINLYRLERKQTFPKWQEAAQYAFDLLKNCGFEAEKIDFPADGKTAYQDKVTPLGWDCTHMKLTVLTPVQGLSDPVISDYDQEPLMAVKGSVATPPEGITARVVTEGQMKAGEDVRGCFVLLDPTSRPRGDNMRMMLDLGAVGWISDYLENLNTTHDDVAWINAGTEHNAWHVQAGDRDFIGYQITPRTGTVLRGAVQKGQVLVHAESDGRRYETFLPAVTAVLPGESEKEVWMVGHLYEPLIEDNSNGVIGAIGILKALRDMAAEGVIRLKYSVRVIFASEMYGFAAMTEYLGGCMSEKTLGGTNMDGILGIPCIHGRYVIELNPAAEHLGGGRPDGVPGNILQAAVAKAYAENYDLIHILPGRQHLADDCFLGDATVDVPICWFHNQDTYHHNSVQDDTLFDAEACAHNLMMCGAWVAAMVSLTQAQLEAMLPLALENAQALVDAAAGVRGTVKTPPAAEDPFAWKPDGVPKTPGVRPGEDPGTRVQAIWQREYDRIAGLRQWWGDSPEIARTLEKLVRPKAALPAEPAAEGKSWYDYAENFVFGRAERGFPHDLAKLPIEQRRALHGAGPRVPQGEILSRLDGRKTFREVIRETEWNQDIRFDEKTVKGCLIACAELAELGYLTMEEKEPLTGAALTEALRTLGVREGDTLLVHSALSNLGYMAGGAETVIAAIWDAVGEQGTFAAPAFARPYVMFEGTLNKRLDYRPYDTRPDGALRDVTINTGLLPRTMLKNPLSYRSGHATHEWVALGAGAGELVAGHGLLDAPTGATSPLQHALDADGSVVFLGCSVASNTFLHYLEDCADAPFLQPAVLRYIDAKGTWRTGFIPRHLPGHRDFYDAARHSDFYDEAVRRGLHIDSVPFGMATLYRMKLRELYDIGMAMFRDDPVATLCHNPGCAYCRAYRK